MPGCPLPRDTGIAHEVRGLCAAYHQALERTRHGRWVSDLHGHRHQDQEIEARLRYDGNPLGWRHVALFPRHALSDGDAAVIHAVAAITLLAQQCASEVATEAVVPLVMTESGGDDMAINVNRGPRVRARSVAEGAALVRQYMALGYTVDVGLAQINSQNFSGLGVSVEQVFEPCTNLRLASKVLQQGYGLASRHYTGLDAISATYSLYNTGTLTRGFRNGYVGRVWSAAAGLGSIQAAPPIPGGGLVVTPPRNAPKVAVVEDSWVVGQVASTTVEVFK